MPVPAKMIYPNEVAKGDILYWPASIMKELFPELPSSWNEWKVVKVTKNTFTMRYGRPAQYSFMDNERVMQKNTKGKLCKLLT